MKKILVRLVDPVPSGHYLVTLSEEGTTPYFVVFSKDVTRIPLLRVSGLEEEESGNIVKSFKKSLGSYAILKDLIKQYSREDQYLFGYVLAFLIRDYMDGKKRSREVFWKVFRLCEELSFYKESFLAVFSDQNEVKIFLNELKEKRKDMPLTFLERVYTMKDFEGSD